MPLFAPVTTAIRLNDIFGIFVGEGTDVEGYLV